MKIVRKPHPLFHPYKLAILDAAAKSKTGEKVKLTHHHINIGKIKA